MTFKEYIERIQGNIFCIEEHFNKRLICKHLVFGFNQDDSEDVDPKTKDDYILFGTNGYDHPTYIDSAQQIELKENSVLVTDRDGNRIELTFRATTIIPHPAQ